MRRSPHIREAETREGEDKRPPFIKACATVEGDDNNRRLRLAVFLPTGFAHTSTWWHDDAGIAGLAYAAGPEGDTIERDSIEFVAGLEILVSADGTDDDWSRARAAVREMLGITEDDDFVDELLERLRDLGRRTGPLAPVHEIWVVSRTGEFYAFTVLVVAAANRIIRGEVLSTDSILNGLIRWWQLRQSVATAHLEVIETIAEQGD